MLSSRRLMLAIKFIDSPVDLGPCPQSPIGAPGGQDPAPAHYRRNSQTRSRSWARIQSPDYWGNHRSTSWREWVKKRARQSQYSPPREI